MKVLFLNTFSNTGGAAIASSRLACALQKNGVEVTFLSRKNIAWGPDFLKKQSWSSIIDRAIIKLFNCFGDNIWSKDYALVGQDITKTEEYRQADIIHLHWINQGFISLGTLRKIAKSGKKVVWTMHDEWPFEAAYHYSEDKKPRNLLERRVLFKKRNIYSESDITFVACSQWLKNLSEQKPLGNNCKIVSIPNTIDTDLFAPVPHENKKRVLFVAQKVTDERKGIKYLDEASKLLSAEITVSALGRDIPYVNDPKAMAAIYASFDAFVVPSLQDNLPNTIMEAMSCGVPCVGFYVGGIPEMIDHKQNGYLAEYKNAQDLANGIEFVLDPANHETLCANSREKVLRCYNEKLIASSYIGVYNN